MGQVFFRVFISNNHLLNGWQRGGHDEDGEGKINQQEGDDKDGRAPEETKGHIAIIYRIFFEFAMMDSCTG